jgi:outer membrane protein assembly factor BamB
MATAVNASPVIADHTAFVANGIDEVFAVDVVTGFLRWHAALDPIQGFAWGNATVGAPAYAHGMLVVPTLYDDVVALDAATGAVRWRHASQPGLLRTTHYRGKGRAGYEAQPVITGDIVWVAGTDGRIAALELATGAELWHTDLGVPVLGGLAVSGPWLVATSYDGTVHALVEGIEHATADAASCEARPRGGCCETGGPPPLALAAVIAFALRRRRASA